MVKRKRKGVGKGKSKENKKDEEHAVVANSKSEWAEKCKQWIISQKNVAQDCPEAPEVEDHDEVDDDNDVPAVDSDVPLRVLLKNYTEKEILNSVLYECEWNKCDYETDMDIEYYVHVDNHFKTFAKHTDREENYICQWDLCQFKSKSLRDLEGHVHYHAYHTRLKTHGASLASLISIPKCNYDSRQRNNISGNKITFECQWTGCKESYNKAQEFFNHVNYHVHDLFPLDKKRTRTPVQCGWSECQKKYTKRYMVIEHIQTHTSERGIGCFTCGSLFRARLKFLDHCKRQMDLSAREFVCGHCEKSFASRVILKDHMKIHVHRYKCNICGISCISKQSLATHFRYRHVTERTFECKKCEKKSVTKLDFQEHILTHKADRVYNCTEFECEVTFKTFKSLKRHIITCHGGSTAIYMCNFCDKQYKSSMGLSKHLRSIHNIKPTSGHTRLVFRPDDDGIFRYFPQVDRFLPHKMGVECNKEVTTTTTPNNEENVKFYIEKMVPSLNGVVSVELQRKPKNVEEENQDITPAGAGGCRSFENVLFEDATQEIKKIDDFKVMKKYLKKSRQNNIIITVNETDHTGSVVNSETYDVAELCMVDKI